QREIGLKTHIRPLAGREARSCGGTARGLSFVMDRDEQKAIELSKRYGIPYASLENKILRAESGQNLESLVPENFARKNSILPLFLDQNVLAVAITDPANVLLIDDLKIHSGHEIQPFIASKRQIHSAIDAFYAGKVLPPSAHARENWDAQTVSLVNAILKQAIAERATEIRIERLNGSLGIRFRIGGALTDRPGPSSQVFDAIAARLMTLA